MGTTSSSAPPYRRLRVYAFDPSLALRLKTVPIHEITIRLPWEELQPGPIGEYIEVVDVDPASGVVYPPVEPERSEPAGAGRPARRRSAIRSSISRWSTRSR